MADCRETTPGDLRERVADMLAHNDACGPGPVSRSEYLADADALQELVIAEVLTALREHWSSLSMGEHLEWKRAADFIERKFGDRQ